MSNLAVDSPVIGSSVQQRRVAARSHRASIVWSTAQSNRPTADRGRKAEHACCFPCKPTHGTGEHYRSRLLLQNVAQVRVVDRRATNGSLVWRQSKRYQRFTPLASINKVCLKTSLWFSNPSPHDLFHGGKGARDGFCGALFAANRRAESLVGSLDIAGVPGYGRTRQGTVQCPARHTASIILGDMP